MKPINKQDKGDNEPNRKEYMIIVGGALVLIAIFAIVMPEHIPTGECPRCNPDNDSRNLAERLTDQGWTLYVAGGGTCMWCVTTLDEFGESARDLDVVNCGMAHQAYRFENESGAEAAYNWMLENGTQVEAMNLTYANRTVEYDGYGILGRSNRNPACVAANVSGYPTWIAPNGTQIIGYRSSKVIEGWLK